MYFICSISIFKTIFNNYCRAWRHGLEAGLYRKAGVLQGIILFGGVLEETVLRVKPVHKQGKPSPGQRLSSSSRQRMFLQKRPFAKQRLFAVQRQGRVGAVIGVKAALGAEAIR